MTNPLHQAMEETNLQDLRRLVGEIEARRAEGATASRATSDLDAIFVAAFSKLLQEIVGPAFDDYAAELAQLGWQSHRVQVEALPDGGLFGMAFIFEPRRPQPHLRVPSLAFRVMPGMIERRVYAYMRRAPGLPTLVAVVDLEEVTADWLQAQLNAVLYKAAEQGWSAPVAA